MHISTAVLLKLQLNKTWLRICNFKLSIRITPEAPVTINEGFIVDNTLYRQVY